MSAEVITKEDLQEFRLQLINDFRQLINFKPAEEKPEWVKSAQVRKILNVSPGTLQNLRINGQLHPKKIGGVWYYNLPEINTLFKSSH